MDIAQLAFDELKLRSGWKGEHEEVRKAVDGNKVSFLVESAVRTREISRDGSIVHNIIGPICEIKVGSTTSHRLHNFPLDEGGCPHETYNTATMGDAEIRRLFGEIDYVYCGWYPCVVSGEYEDGMEYDITAKVYNILTFSMDAGGHIKGNLLIGGM